MLLFGAYTERGERISVISARKATQHEQDDYFAQNASTDVYGHDRKNRAC
jgi:uncharacterized DUF497 family protein